MVLNPFDLVGGHYLARDPANADDVPTNLYAVVIQHYSYPEVLALAEQMHADIVNALASMHRYFVLLFYANRFCDFAATTQMVAAEVEYAFGNYRAFYDLLNRFVALFRVEPQYSARTLPDSFRKTIQRADDELVTSFGLPPGVLAVLRSRQTAFFALRSLRDAIFHRGAHVADIIYQLEDGFAISAESELLVKLQPLQIWSTALLRNDRLASLLPLLAFMLRDIREVADATAMAVIDALTPPDPIAHGYAVFFRSPLTRHLRNLERYQREHWFTPEQILELRERQ